MPCSEIGGQFVQGRRERDEPGVERRRRGCVGRGKGVRGRSGLLRVRTRQFEHRHLFADLGNLGLEA